MIRRKPIATTIPAIRGQGSPSACAGQTVVVNGVVTAALPGLNGLFLQDPMGDGDPTTSDAIFVLTGSTADLPDASSVVEATAARGRNGAGQWLQYPSADRRLAIGRARGRGTRPRPASDC